MSRDDIEEKFKPVYREFIQQQVSTYDLLKCAQIITNPEASEQDKAVARLEYKRLNEAVYGEVDTDTYHATLAWKLDQLTVNPEDHRAVALFDEITDMIPPAVLTDDNVLYKPQESTLSAVKNAAENLWSGLLRHIPEETVHLSADEIADVFQTILDDEFAESAEGWTIERGGVGISVEASTRTISVSNTMSGDGPKIRGLIAHEFVHVLSAIRGYETGVLPMALGFAKYGPSQEGLGRVLEMAVSGNHEVAGVAPYITIGYMSDGHGFRDTFELKWRIAALEAIKEGEMLTDEMIDAARNKAYVAVSRVARGTDSMPLHKDIYYYDGTKKMWEYFETFEGDEFMLNMALLGKFDPTNQDDFRAALETHTR
jgi:hypothetical protein